MTSFRSLVLLDLKKGYLISKKDSSEMQSLLTGKHLASVEKYGRERAFLKPLPTVLEVIQVVDVSVMKSKRVAKEKFD